MEKKEKLSENLKIYIKREKLNLVITFFSIFVFLIILIFYFWPSYRDYNQLKYLIKQKEDLLKRYQDKIKEIGNIKLIENKYKKYIYVGKDPYIIISDLQDRFKYIEGLTIRSFRIINQKDFLGKYKKISVNFNIQGDIKDLVEMLDILKKLEKAIQIKRLNISRFISRGQEYLQINLQVEAIFLPE